MDQKPSVASASRAGTAVRLRSGKASFAHLLQMREVLLFAVILALSLAISRLTPYFLTSGNLKAMLIGMVPTAIIAVGTAIVLVGGGLDLSVGSVMALSGTVAGLLMLTGTPIWLALSLTLMVGGLIGLANGLVITRIRVN
ncbi:MAG TPA: ABC transporter permease, partial [bacterium]|nr:ABC transporter permease [bacterium]